MRLDDGYVPIQQFGPDHWSTLLYAETVMVDCAGFQVGFDPRMRQGRAHFRVMAEQYARPKRTTRHSVAQGAVMDKQHSTRLHDGSVVDGHDDWHCVQDLINAGLLGMKRHDGIVLPLVEDCDPGVVLHLTPLGSEVVRQLRDFKAAGGSVSSHAFVPVITPVMPLVNEPQDA